MSLLSFEEWNEMFFDYLIQMYNSIVQRLNFQLEVVYPMEYISKAIP
jgi:hypothetical protein